MSTAVIARPGLGRLTGVELRKMVDTRAGLWLMIVLVLSAVGIVLAQWLGGNEGDHVLEDFLSSTTQATSVLLPVLGILAVTSEWSQRTALTTFSLVPARERVVAAKLLAGISLTLAALAACLLAAAIGTALSGGAWHLGLGALGKLAVFQGLGVLGGLAFGLLFLNSPLAIVLYYVLPTIWAILSQAITALNGVSEWLDTSQTFQALVEHGMTGEDWAKVAASCAVWVVLPLALGTVRLLRREVA